MVLRGISGGCDFLNEKPLRKTAAKGKLLRDAQMLLSAHETTDRPHSHSIVPGGLLVISKQTRFTPLTSLMMRLESFSIRSYGSFTQSAVMPSCDSTARMAMV